MRPVADGRRDVLAAVLIRPGALELRSFPDPPPAEDDAVVAVELCGICGTDLKYFSGKLAAPYPLILGHEVVGRVERIGQAAAQRYGVEVGDRVIVESSIPCWSCEVCRSGAYQLCPTKGGYGTRVSTDTLPSLWGGMAQRMYIAPGSVLHRIPGSLDARAALGVPILANALRWLVQRGGLAPGGRVLIQGCGPQGLAAALIAQIVGAAETTVTGLASDAARLAYAAETGARTVVVDPAWTRADRLAAVGSAFDVVLDVTGSPSAIAGAPAHLRAQGTFVLAGLAGGGTSVPIATDELIWREIRIQGVLSKDEAAIRAALRLVTNSPPLADRLGRLVSHTFPLEEAASAIGALEGNLEGFVKAAVRPS